MRKFEYTFDIEETTITRCVIEVEAETLEAAMAAVEEHGPWGWEVHYGKQLWYECQETGDNDPNNSENWDSLPAFLVSKEDSDDV